MNNEQKQKEINRDKLINWLPSTGIIEYFIYKNLVDLADKNLVDLVKEKTPREENTIYEDLINNARLLHGNIISFYFIHLKLKNFETLAQNHKEEFSKICYHSNINPQYDYGQHRNLIAKLENLIAKLENLITKLFIYQRLWTNTIQFSDLYHEIKTYIKNDEISIEDIKKFSMFQPLTTEEFEELFLKIWEEFVKILKNFFKV